MGRDCLTEAATAFINPVMPACARSRPCVTVANRRFGLPTVDFVFGKTATRSRLKSVVRTFEGNLDRFTLVLGSDAQLESNSMEMSTNGMSADDIARLRARRILLDETLQASPARSGVGFGEDGMLETLVRGLNTSVEVVRSPLPELARNIGVADKRRVLAAAELTAVLWLRLSGTVTHIFELELKFQGANALV